MPELKPNIESGSTSAEEELLLPDDSRITVKKIAHIMRFIPYLGAPLRTVTLQPGDVYRGEYEGKNVEIRYYGVDTNEQPVMIPVGEQEKEEEFNFEKFESWAVAKLRRYLDKSIEFYKTRDGTDDPPDVSDRVIAETARGFLIKLAGFDSNDAWMLRNDIINICAKSDVSVRECLARSIAGVYSEGSEKFRERLVEESDLDLLADSLIGIDTPRAWEMRKIIKDKTATSSWERYYATSLIGLDTQNAWNCRKDILDPYDLLWSITGLNSKEAWEVRERIRKDNRDSVSWLRSIVSSLLGIDSERANELRSLLVSVNTPQSADWDDNLQALSMSFTGVDSEAAWKWRKETLALDGTIYVGDSLAGLSSLQAESMREELLRANDISPVFFSMGINGDHTTLAWQLRKRGKIV